MKYREIRRILDLSKEKDIEAAELLDSMLKTSDIAILANELGGRNVAILGAGSSLKKDLKELKKYNLQNKLTIIAADGAISALLEEKIIPRILVTDLDGNINSIIKANRSGVITIVHAHGDNKNIIKKIVPRLDNIIGTTQTEEFGKLKNFGGFTDGDRAVYIASHFNAKTILLFGMDFGEKIGFYSGSYEHKKKIKKLKIGKKLIEEIANINKSTTFLNATSGGEQITGIPHIKIKELKSLLLKSRT